MGDFKELEKIFNEVDQELATVNKRIVNDQQIFEDLKVNRVSVMEEIGQGIANEAAQGTMTKLENRKKELDASIERTGLGIKALYKKRLDVSNRIGDLRRDMNQTFGKAAEGWLKEEIISYEKILADFIRCVKRLKACQSLLTERDGLSVYRNVVGEAFEYLGLMRVARIKDFDIRDYTYPNQVFHYAKELEDQLMDEILK